MLVEILIAILLGILFGIFTGLIPGVHINLISQILLILFVNSIFKVEIFVLIVFCVSMAITHTFLDFIPSLLIGVPNENNVLSVMPAHRMLIKGNGFLALKYSAVASFFGIIFSFLLSFLFYFFIKNFYFIFKIFIPYFLIFVLILSILLEKKIDKIFWALVVVFFAGAFGNFALNSTLISNPLMILYVGFFAISGILFSLKEKNEIPKQKYNSSLKLNFDFFKILFIGGFISSICSILPGIGNSQAALSSSLFLKKIKSFKEEMYIILTSLINGVSFVLSLITYFVLQKSRNGVVFVISQFKESINFNQLIFLFFVVFIVSIVAYFLTIKIGKISLFLISKINIFYLNVCILIFLVLIIFFIDGIFGILFLITSVFLGSLVLKLGIKRIHLLSSLLIPIVLSLI